MDVLKLRTSTAVDKSQGFKAVDKALRMDAVDSDQTQPQSQGQLSAPNTSPAVLSADTVSMYLRGISENSTDELDALMSDLRGLREKLVDDGSQIEQDILDFAAFSQSVANLAEAVSKGVSQVKTAQPRRST
jgi:hypothetical protein